MRLAAAKTALAAVFSSCCGSWVSQSSLGAAPSIPSPARRQDSPPCIPACYCLGNPVGLTPILSVRQGWPLTALPPHRSPRGVSGVSDGSAAVSRCPVRRQGHGPLSPGFQQAQHKRRPGGRRREGPGAPPPRPGHTTTSPAPQTKSGTWLHR